MGASLLIEGVLVDCADRTDASAKHVDRTVGNRSESAYVLGLAWTLVTQLSFQLGIIAQDGTPHTQLLDN